MKPYIKQIIFLSLEISSLLLYRLLAYNKKIEVMNAINIHALEISPLTGCTSGNI